MNAENATCNKDTAFRSTAFDIILAVSKGNDFVHKTGNTKVNPEVAFDKEPARLILGFDPNLSTSFTISPTSEMASVISFTTDSCNVSYFMYTDLPSFQYN